MPTEEASNIVVTLVVAAAAVVVAYILGTIVSIVVRRAGRRSEFVRDVSHRMRRPLRAVLVVLALLIALRSTTNDADRWTVGTEHWLLIIGIGVGAWFVGALAFVVEDSVLARFRTDVVDNRHARRVRTQVVVVRRVTVALVVICAIAAMLFTFPAARTAGTSLLASAGLISIVAGLAAQTALGNVFAGMQIAFTDAIRVDDVVVLEGEWGRIEEITMTYVVVHLWDDRRLIMPCTYFTTTPFQNWTRRAAELLGTVEIDLDWDVPVPAMRAELKRLLDASPLWDKRVGILQVTDATNGYVRMRALASAADAGTLFDLRCYVREGLVDWLQRAAPQGMPRTRLTTSDAKVGAALESVGGDSAAIDLGKTPVRSGVLDSLFDEQRYGAERDKPKVTSEPELPRRIAPRSARPGVRMHLSEPARGFHNLPEPVPSEEKTTILGAVPADESGQGTPVPGQSTDESAGTMAWATSEGLFTGSEAAVERSKAFSGPGQEVIDERERTAMLDAVTDDDLAGVPGAEGVEGESVPERRHAGHEAAGSAAAQEASGAPQAASAATETGATGIVEMTPETSEGWAAATPETSEERAATTAQGVPAGAHEHDAAPQDGDDTSLDRSAPVRTAAEDAAQPPANPWVAQPAAAPDGLPAEGGPAEGGPVHDARPAAIPPSGARRAAAPEDSLSAGPVPPPPPASGGAYDEGQTSAPQARRAAEPVEAPAPVAEPTTEAQPSVTRTGVLRRSVRSADTAAPASTEQTARLPRVTEETTRLPRFDGEDGSVGGTEGTDGEGSGGR
ncbi:mechanosensitive ion channel domain-containing protein [Sanguibacter inulinus]|uniref:mechanosensitive ion channel domain-containing protein n=1 Tax=Sanguibacter inulinus TaxID=60922 RepID=UPI0028064C60|nr:mechanosensitive ion channel domain-containing protein [Sanguibacter inulinus]